MISYRLLIDNVDYPMEQGAEIILDKTKTFDSASFTVKHITREEPFEEGTSAIIIIEPSETFDGLIVQSDLVTKISSTLYNHEIILVEETAKLTKHVGADRFLSVKSDGTNYTYKEHLEIFNNTEPFNNPNTLYTVDPSTLTALDITAPEKKYENMTHYQKVVEIFRGIQSTPRLRNGVLTHTPYNERNNFITIGSVNGQRKENDYNNFAKSVKSKAKNVTFGGDLISAATLFPSPTSGITPRSPDGRYDDDTAEFQLDKPIRRIIEARVLNVPLSGGGTTELVINCISKEEWDGLQLGSNDSAVLQTEDAQRNSLYYVINSSTVNNVGTTFPSPVPLFPNTVIYEAISRAAFRSAVGAVNELPIKEYEIRFFYQPFIDMDFTVERGDNKILKNSMILSNQKDSVLDIGRYANVLSDYVNQLSNDKYTIKRRLLDVANRYELGDYTSDNFQVIRIRYELYGSHIDETVELSQNYANLDAYSSINRDYRPYTISRDNLKAHFLNTNYIEISETSRLVTGTLIEQGIKTLLNAFDYDSADDLPVYLCQYESDDTGLSPGQKITTGAIGLGTQGFRFVTGFKDPKLAGNQLDLNDGLFSADDIETIKYTDDGGGVDEADFTFINDVFVNPNQYPQTATALTADTLIDLGTRKLSLDPNEILELTAEFITKGDDNVIIYDKFSQDNSLVRELALAPNWKVFYSGQTTVYDKYDKVVKEQSIPSESYTFDKTNRSIEVRGLQLTWAIADATTEELVFAVNWDGTTRRKFYFNCLDTDPNASNL